MDQRKNAKSLWINTHILNSVDKHRKIIQFLKNPIIFKKFVWTMSYLFHKKNHIYLDLFSHTCIVPAIQWVEVVVGPLSLKISRQQNKKSSQLLGWLLICVFCTIAGKVHVCMHTPTHTTHIPIWESKFVLDHLYQ